MANEKRLIDANALTKMCREQMKSEWNRNVCPESWAKAYEDFIDDIDDAPTVDAYTAHEVAEIIADLFGDTCACNFNRIDEWLPEKCELLDACPDTVGVACWEQYLKYRRSAKMDGDGNG